MVAFKPIKNRREYKLSIPDNFGQFEIKPFTLKLKTCFKSTTCKKSPWHKKCKLPYNLFPQGGSL
jgi:hypothetical protein